MTPASLMHRGRVRYASFPAMKFVIVPSGVRRNPITAPSYSVKIPATTPLSLMESA